MDWEKHDEQMCEIQELMDKLDPASDDYEKCVKRLMDMQEMQIKGQKLFLEETKQEKELNLEEERFKAETEQGTKEGKNEMLRIAIDAGKTMLYVVGIVGVSVASIYAEEFRILNSGAFRFLNFLRPKV